MTPEHLLVESDGSVVTIVINRPAVLNALSSATLEQLDAALSAASDDERVGAIVLTGAGNRAFAAGADVRELASYSPFAARDHSERAQAIFTRVERLRVPVIAAVNGFAYGGGCELALACAMRIAADTARFAQPEINLGLLPGYGGTYRLPRLIGRGRALEMLLTGDPMSADEAWRVGLVNRVVPAASLMTEARALAEAIAGKAPLARRYVLEAVAGASELTSEAAAAHEARLFGLAFATEDKHEGTRAFLDKRRPAFKGQ